MQQPPLIKFAWLSIATAIFTIGLKTAAYLLTGSVGLLSDAVESLVNLVGGVMALAMLTISAKPADDDHAYGHGKAEYFSSGVEGSLILVAALSIAVAAVPRLFSPHALEKVGAGLAVSSVAAIANLVTGLLLLRAGKQYTSITLQANGHHLLTDVWTSIGVLIAVGLVGLTGYQWLDPVIALVVAGNILFTAQGIIRRSIAGLMDVALPPSDQRKIKEVQDSFRGDGLEFHALRTRQAGARRFVSFHVLVPGHWTVHDGHAVLERIEAAMHKALPNTTVFTHLEPLEDPKSWHDTGLDRREGRQAGG